MEKLLLEKLNLLLDPLSEAPSHLRALSTARSLLANPNSSDSTCRAVLETLIRSLDHHRGDPTFIRHVVKVLGDAASLHRPLSPAVITALRSLLDGGKRLAADALAVLASVADCEVLDEDLVLSLASSPIMSVRLQLIHFLVASVDDSQSSALLWPRLMVRVFLGLAVDLYPSVRSAAVDGLVALWRKDYSLIDNSMAKCCYDLGVMLFRDEDELVRLAAV